MPALNLTPGASSAELGLVLPKADALPFYLYGASYGVLNNHLLGFHTPGRHYAEIAADLLRAGPVTSYAVNGRRAIDVAHTLLAGSGGAGPMSGLTGMIEAGKWPGTANRSGLIIFDDLGNDAMYQATMVAASIVVRAIASADYLTWLKNLWRASHAAVSSQSRVEESAMTATSGAWSSGALGWASGGALVSSTEVGAYRQYSLTPPQSGPLAGKVYLVCSGDIPMNLGLAQVSISVD